MNRFQQKTRVKSRHSTSSGTAGLATTKTIPATACLEDPTGFPLRVYSLNAPFYPPSGSRAHARPRHLWVRGCNLRHSWQKHGPVMKASQSDKGVRRGQGLRTWHAFPQLRNVRQATRSHRIGSARSSKRRHRVSDAPFVHARATRRYLGKDHHRHEAKVEFGKLSILRAPTLPSVSPLQAQPPVEWPQG